MDLKKNVSLSPLTTFKIGGACDYFCEIKSKKDLLECFSWFKKEGIRFFCLGGGSNILVNDKGFAGAVIKIAQGKSKWIDHSSIVSAGKTLANLINEAKERNLAGLEWAFGIPATFGGAIKNNAGAFGFNISENIEWVDVFDSQKLNFERIAAKDCLFSYRNSVFQQRKDWIIWEAKVNWKEKNKKDIAKEIEYYLEKRRGKQPLSQPSAGSFFKNVSLLNISSGKVNDLVEKFVREEIKKGTKREEIEEKIRKNGSLPAAFFIEKAGLKGRKIGGAQVSPKHANFIINVDNAKAEDVIILASIIKQKVRNIFGVQLQEEVEYVGFE